MTDKYYTPTIDEFCFNFEYENLEYNCEFKKTKITEWSQAFIFKTKIASGDIRVKYLDKEDIESLGWVFLEYINFTDSKGLTYKNTKGILLDLYSDGIDIYNYIAYDEVQHFFRGTIKNKSELIKLMKQLGI